MNIKLSLPILFTGLLASCQPAPTTAPERLVLNNVNIIDVAVSETLYDSTIIIEGERITSIEKTADFNSEANDTVLDLTGQYVIPGLINGHVHFGMADDPDSTYQLILREGVTGIRDLGGPAAPMKQFSTAGDENPGSRPDVYFAGTLAGPAFREDPRIAPLIAENGGDDPEGIWFVDQDADIEPSVKAAKAAGAHGLKLYTALSAAQLNTITPIAEANGLKIWTHAVIFPANSTDVINSKPTEIIHTKGLIAAKAENLPGVFMPGVRGWIPKQNFDLATLDTPRFQDAFAQIAAAGIAINPALIADGDLAMEKRALPPWMSDFRNWACEATSRAQKLDITITAGTDFDGGPGLLNREMRRLTECGLTPSQALRAATFNNAKVLGIQDDVGLVAAGYKANLVVLNSDPTVSLAALDDIIFVIKDGIKVDAGTGN